MRRGGLKNLGAQDVFVNVVGGLTIRERASDAAVSLAIASSLKDVTVSTDTAVLGEIGLGGEMRRVAQLERRLQELHRLGFKRALIPRQPLEKKFGALQIQPVADIRALLDALK